MYVWICECVCVHKNTISWAYRKASLYGKKKILKFYGEKNHEAQENLEW